MGFLPSHMSLYMHVSVHETKFFECTEIKRTDVGKSANFLSDGYAIGILNAKVRTEKRRKLWRERINEK